MLIEYNIDDLRTNSSNLLKEHESMTESLNSLNDLTASFEQHWSGAAYTAYIGFFTDTISSLESYLDELNIIASNLNTAADYYKKHEEYYNSVTLR